MSKFNKFLKLGEIFRNYRPGRGILRYFPIRLWLEPTNRCNLRCRMCPNGLDYEAVRRGDMDWELFKKIVDEAKLWVEDINLFHRGESLLDPKILEMVAYIKARKIPVRLHTNATLLDEKLGAGLIEAGLDYLSVSFDGFEAETYEKIRAGARFEAVLSNVINFLKIKKSKKLKKPLVVLQLMDFSRQPKEKKQQLKKEFLQKFKGLPLDRFTIRIPHNWAGFWEEERAKPGPKSKYAACLFPYYSLTILFDGRVLPCPQDFYSHLEIGNVCEQSLATIWNSPILVNLRHRLHEKNLTGLNPCETCDVPYRKSFLGLTRGYLRTFLADKLKV